MAIWTSRYSNKELSDDKYYTIGISIGKPRFRLGYVLRDQCYSLAPKRYMLNMDIESFKKAYYEKLEEIGKDKIISMVTRLEKRARNESKDLVLLCFEDVRVEENWCHRSIFAEWWAEHVGEVIKELPDPTPPKEKKEARTDSKQPAKEITKKDSGYQQMSLFGMAGF